MSSPEAAVETHHDVTVIGGGWSGLTACKYMIEEGLSVITLEKREDIGGVWNYSSDPSIPTVMKSTQCSSSSTVTEMSDYPMPESIGMFPHHTDVLEYLRSYAREFNLFPHLKFNMTVTSAEKERDIWKVRCSTGEIYTSTYLIVATGPQCQPNRELEVTSLKEFTGKVLHACEVKEPLEEYRGRRVLIVGGGETGSDICMEWYNHAQFIYWSIPRGQHFFRKYAKIIPWNQPQALDKASSRMLKTIAPFDHSKPGLAWVCKWTTNGSLLAYQGHGIPEWKNNATFFKFVINKSGRVLDYVDYNKLVPKAGITECKGKQVTFTDGTKQEFDLVIMSTGYKERFPFLPGRYADFEIRQRHKMVFDVEDPSIAFIGLVRPIVGSVVGISELQARWAAKIYSKNIPMKTLEERRKAVEEDTAYWNEYFKNSSQRIGGLVEGFTYIDDIAHQAQIYPNYWSLFKRSPRKWFSAYFSPYNGATYRLNEPDKIEQAIATMNSHRKATLGPLQYLLIMFLRFILFDWWLDHLGEIKYRIQTAWWWSNIRSLRVVSAMNSIWLIPKKAFFDNYTDDSEEMSAQAKSLMKSNASYYGSDGTKILSNGSIPNGNVPNGHLLTRRYVRENVNV